MSEKIDVLAVMDSVIQRSGHVVACDVVAARAAVAELIEAAKDVCAWDDDHLRHHVIANALLADEIARLRAALARVRGS